MAEAYYAEDYIEFDYYEGDSDVSLLGFNVTAFQSDAFQWGFQMMDTIPTFTNFPVPELFRVTRSGQSIVIPCVVSDIYTSLGIKLPFNPSSVPQLKIYSPDGSVLHDFLDMTFMDTGVYILEYDITESHESGVYYGQFRAVNGEMESLTPKILLFKVE